MKNKLYYKGELLTEISYQNGKIWVSDEIVKKNNCYIQFYDERFDGVIRWAENDSNIKADHYKKIICQSPELNIEGVPYVEFIKALQSKDWEVVVECNHCISIDKDEAKNIIEPCNSANCEFKMQTHTKDRKEFLTIKLK